MTIADRLLFYYYAPISQPYLEVPRCFHGVFSSDVLTPVHKGLSAF
jgi:hypothetical protein